MSDDTGNEQNQNSGDEPSKLRQQLQEEGSARKAAEEELKKLRQELVLSKVGLDRESGPAKLFLKAYDGEWTEEAVKDAMSEYGIEAKTGTEESEKPSVPEAEKKAFEAMGSAAGTAGPPEEEKTPDDRAKEAYNAALAETGNEEHAQAVFLRQLILEENERILAEKK